MIKYNHFFLKWETYMRPQWVNSLRPSDAYMRHQPRPSLVQMMACHLIGAKPLSEPMLYYCQLDPQEQTSVKLYSKFKYFHSGKCIWKCYLENVSHFVSASMGYCCQVTTTPTQSVHIVPSVWSPGLTPAHVQSLQWLSNNQQGTHCTTQHRNLLQFSIYCPGSHVPEFNPWC